MIQINVNQKGLKVAAVQAVVEAAVKAKWPEASVSAHRQDPPESRADRFAEAQGMASDAKGEAEALMEELQGWFDNLPENLQGSDKGSQLEEAIEQLQEFIDAMDTAEGVSVDFPGMY